MSEHIELQNVTGGYLHAAWKSGRCQGVNAANGQCRARLKAVTYQVFVADIAARVCKKCRVWQEQELVELGDMWQNTLLREKQG